jgi:hypothetical protein
LVAFLHGKQLRNLHMSASARFPACGLSQRLPERHLLVFPSAAVAEVMLPRLECAGSALPACVVLSVSKPL